MKLHFFLFSGLTVFFFNIQAQQTGPNAPAPRPTVVAPVVTPNVTTAPNIAPAVPEQNVTVTTPADANRSVVVPNQVLVVGGGGLARIVNTTNGNVVLSPTGSTNQVSTNISSGYAPAQNFKSPTDRSPQPVQRQPASTPQR
jgi:hypothetical protein